MGNQLQSKVINNKNILVVVTILTLVGLNMIQFIVNQQDDELAKEQLDSKQLELINTYTKLDTISTQLSQKITQVRRLGGNVDSLISIKNQLEKDKLILKQAAAQASQQSTLAVAKYEQIKSKLEGYEKVVALKDEEIARKEGITEELVSERNALLERQDKLAEKLNRLEIEKNKLLEQMNVAARLDLKNIRFYTIDKQGIANESEEFKSEKLERLKVSVRISRNDLTPKGIKQVMMRIIEPEGASLYTPKSGTFNFEGRQIFYTAATEFYFDNKEEKVDLLYVKGSSYTKGTHKVEFYCSGSKIGEGSFEVK